MSVLETVAVPNPWLTIKAGRLPYCTPDDLPLVQAHNTRLSRRYEPENADLYRLPLATFPEPFLGHPDAPVRLLNLNPGHKNDDPIIHAKKPIIDLCTANLRHTSADDCPFYPLSPRYLLNGGSRWWSQRMRDWLEQYGREWVARAFFCIELFPYGSQKYHSLPELVPSQQYSIALAAAKVRAGCTLIVMRAETKWREVVPDLRESGYYPLNSNQSIYLSRNSLPREAAGRIEQELRSA